MSRTTEPTERILPHERHLRILEKARTRPQVEVSTLADELDVTTETIRRDLTLLERRGFLRRVHGGAVHIDRLGYEPSVAARREHQIEAKQRIGHLACSYLPDGGSILVDGGTTTLELVRQLPPETELTVVTNSIAAATALAELPKVDILFLGGHLRKLTGASVGSWATAALTDLHVDVAFMGANGVTPSYGLTTPDAAEAEVKRAMVTAANQVVCLADHTKVGQTQLCRFAALAQVDVLVSDTELAEPLAEELIATGLEVVLA